MAIEGGRTDSAPWTATFGGLASVLGTGTHMVHESAMQTKFSIMEREITMTSANANLKRFTSFLFIYLFI